MTRSIVLATLVAFGGLTVGIAQEFRPVRPPLPDAVKIKDNLYVIGASTPGNDFTGGNTVILVTDSGVVLVDTKLSGYGAVILQKVKKVTDKPVTTIINTHTHGDHVGSNEGFPGSVDIVAQENTKANMAKMTAFQGANASFLPKRTFKDKLTIGSGNNRVDLYYFGPGHTNGDAFVVFPSVRVLQTGDMFAWRDAPVIDHTQGASGVEFPKTLAKALAAPEPAARYHALSAVAWVGPAGPRSRADGPAPELRSGPALHLPPEVLQAALADVAVPWRLAVPGVRPATQTILRHPSLQIRRQTGGVRTDAGRRVEVAS